jgi:hypothetical protein
MRLLANKFEFDPQGEIDIKHSARMPTYLLRKLAKK